ncbi:MAG: hypothetical protein ACK4JA_14260 [Parazoarcus communis]
MAGKKLKPRNPLVAQVLLRSGGGAHEASAKGRRNRDKAELKAALKGGVQQWRDGAGKDDVRGGSDKRICVKGSAFHFHSTQPRSTRFAGLSHTSAVAGCCRGGVPAVTAGGRA